MAVPQKKFREIVFQILYSNDLSRIKNEEIIELLMKELQVTRKTVREALERAAEVMAIQEETDAMITQASVSYAFERIQSVEKNILRLGIYEMFFDDNIPPKVAITEAMRLARKFGSPESANFVNAILDALYQASLGKDIDVIKLEESVQQLSKIEEISKDASLEKMPSSESEDDE